MKNANTRESLDRIRTTVLENLSVMPPAPSAQMAPVPPKHEMVGGWVGGWVGHRRMVGARWLPVARCPLACPPPRCTNQALHRRRSALQADLPAAASHPLSPF